MSTQAVRKALVSFESLAWLFAAAVTLHNLEEAIWLPAWSKAGPRWRVAVDAAEFRFAVSVLTIVAYACAWFAAAGSSVGVYLLCGYALAMALNALIPHLAATIFFRAYAPGAATGCLLNFPISVMLLMRAVTDLRLDLMTFAWAGPLAVAALALSIPILFRIGRAAISLGFLRKTPSSPERRDGLSFPRKERESRS
jgi:hypothetical protein